MTFSGKCEICDFTMFNMSSLNFSLNFWDDVDDEFKNPPCNEGTNSDDCSNPFIDPPNCDGNNCSWVQGQKGQSVEVVDFDFCGSPKPTTSSDTTDKGVISIIHIVNGEEKCTAADMYAEDIGGSRNNDWFQADKDIHFVCKMNNNKGLKVQFHKADGGDHKFLCVTSFGCGDICQGNYYIPS